MTEKDLTEVKQSVRNQFIACVVVNIITFNQGCAVAWVSPSLPILLGDSSPLGDPLSTLQASMVASAFCVGAIIGTPVFGWLADKIGRKKTCLVAALPFLVCWCFKLLWLNPTALIFARLVVGFGGSGTLMVSPVYAAEVASVEYRGVLGSILTFSFNFGIVFIYILGAYMSYFMVLIVMLTIPLIFLGLMWQMPESPSYLVKTNQIKEATKALAWLRRVPAESTLVKKELDQLIHEVHLSSAGVDDSDKETYQNPVAEVSEKISAWKFLITSPPSLRALALTTSLLSVQCFMGIFAVISYATNIFEEAGSTLAPSTCSIVVGVLQLAGSVVASSLIERVGRKVLFISSCSTVIISMTTLGTYFYLRDSGYDVTTVGWIPVVSLSMAVCTFSMGVGPIPFILPSELFMIQVRGLATSIGLTWLWLATFFVAQFYSPIVAYFGSHMVFWGFSFVGCIGIFIAVVFLPETKGKHIDEIVDHFRSKNSKGTVAEMDDSAEELLRKAKHEIKTC